MEVDGSSHGPWCHEAQQQLREIEELAAIGTWSWDLGDGSVWWSPQMARIYGVEPGDGRHTIEEAVGFIHPDDRARVTERMERSTTTGVTDPSNFRIVRADGEVREVVGRSEVVRDDQGRLVRMFGTVQDVTVQHELERRERRLREAAERQDRALEINDDIVQGLSAALLALQLDDPDEAATIIETTLRRTKAIVRGLLAETVSRSGGIRPGDLVRKPPPGEAPAT